MVFGWSFLGHLNTLGELLPFLYFFFSDALDRRAGKSLTSFYHIHVEKLHRLQLTMEEPLGQLTVFLQSLRTLVTLAITLLITYVSVVFGCV